MLPLCTFFHINLHQRDSTTFLNLCCLNSRQRHRVHVFSGPRHSNCKSFSLKILDSAQIGHSMRTSEVIWSRVRSFLQLCPSGKKKQHTAGFIFSPLQLRWLIWIIHSSLGFSVHRHWRVPSQQWGVWSCVPKHSGELRVQLQEGLQAANQWEDLSR